MYRTQYQVCIFNLHFYSIEDGVLTTWHHPGPHQLTLYYATDIWPNSELYLKMVRTSSGIFLVLNPFDPDVSVYKICFAISPILSWSKTFFSKLMRMVRLGRLRFPLP